MKKKDIVVISVILITLTPFFIFDSVYSFYTQFNQNNGFLMSFIKFAILATFGESLGLRIKEGVYNKAGFGLLPRAVVWGVLGLSIKFAFIVFAKGTPFFLIYIGFENADTIIKEAFSFKKLITAFSISVAINTIYAPVMMTLHKITDIHIINNGGTIRGLLRKINFSEILSKINWKIQWNFVFKKTIPFFWIPAHTITFLLQEDMQVLFAALLGIALGLILAFANLKK